MAGDGVFELRVAQPGAFAAKLDVPFIPAAQFVFVENAADHFEGLALKAATNAELNWGGVDGPFAGDANALEVFILTHQDGLAEAAGGLHGCLVTEDDLGAAIGA